MTSLPLTSEDPRYDAQMNLHQRGLVDACFEEGQYDEGIALLNQLRSPKVVPSASHVRQLLYISLYPPALKKPVVDPSMSPSKISKQQQKSLTISPETASSARSALLSFAISNQPEGLARALPSYDKPHGETESDNAESFVAKESYCISQCKSCWNILPKGFIHRAVVSSPTKKGRQRRTTTYEDDDDDDFDTLLVIADHAWPVLDFLLILFERDESETEARQLPRYSPLLLSQIAPSRSGKGARWEADAPLSIILHTLIEHDERRRLMGARLMHLLINLCSTTLFDFTMFLNSVFNRVYTSVPKEFLALLASLPPTIPVLRFRIALFHKFIASGGQAPARPSARPKPQARARPIRRARDVNATPEEQSKPEPTSIVSNPTLPSYTEIRRSIDELQPSENLCYPWLQFHLLVSFGNYQARLSAASRDEEWQNLLQGGGLAQQLQESFPSSEGTIYRELMVGTVASWFS